ncbi:MAG: HAMP domain-containing sensor histidine kinase [Myxococcota bacterium]
MPSSSTRSLRSRILVASLLGAMLCAFTSIGLLVAAVGTQTYRRLSDLRVELGPAGLARCEADPEHFVYDEVLFRIWAYDAGGRSANPIAPPIPPEIFASVQGPGPSRLHSSPVGPWWRRTAIQRVATDGPCAVLYANPPTPMPMLLTMRLTTLFGVSLGLAGALLGTMVLAVRPLVSRLAEVDAAARGVGMDDFHSAGDQGDDEIGRISGTLDQAHDRIVADRRERVRRHRALERHLAAVAHDLRTPLASLQLMLEDLTRQLPDADDPALATVRDARLEVAYLEALADNLHQATRMSAGLVATDGEADLTELVGRVEARFAILGRMLGGTVAAARPDEPVWVACRPALAERALANLVHNGIIHGSGDVGVVLDASDGRFSVTVHSAGPPIDPDLLASLGARRLERPTDPSRTRAPQGSRGLGVAIVNAVARGAGFDLRYEGGEEGGLRVTLSGPVKPSETAG